MTTKHFDRLSLLRRDPGFVGASLADLPQQIRDAWRQASGVKLPKTYRQVTAVAVCGMGGSHLAADILRYVLADRLHVPVTIVADYTLPRWVNQQTLVICSSYSGGTEETLAALTAAKKRRAKIVVVTSGGSLAAAARRWKLPAYVYRPNFNPSNQPRLGVAYSLMATLACWRALGLVSVSPEDIAAMAASATRAVTAYGLKRPTQTNLAKQLAMELYSKMPLLIGAEWTAGNVHTWANQINENAKTFAAWYQLPDLNHHLLEGLRHKAVTRQMHAVMIRDGNFHPRNLRRLTLTKKILEDLGARVSVISPKGKTSLEKSIDLLAFGGYVSWYLAAVRKVKPAPIPTVDALKKALGRKL